MTGERNVLLRCFLAERFASPNDARYPSYDDFKAAEANGLIEWRSGWRVTDVGRARLGDVSAASAAAEFRTILRARRKP